MKKKPKGASPVLAAAIFSFFLMIGLLAMVQADNSTAASDEPISRLDSTDGPGLGGGQALATKPGRVFAFNDLGMHCYDSDFSVFAILPVFNVVHAQVVQVGARPRLLGPSVVKLSYLAQKDLKGSINTTSRTKTNFWQFVQPLFGASLKPDVGLLGARMPGPGNRPKGFIQGFDGANNWFSAAGIPITGWDDSGKRNPFPLMSVRATDASTNTVLSSLPTVVPVSDEMDCGACHLTGGIAASDPAVKWNRDPNGTRQYKKNILLYHDHLQGTHLFNNQPVLCFTCHYSPALDLEGKGPTAQQQNQPFLSHAIHGMHGRVTQDPANSADCYSCHPGKQTQCLRGVMGNNGIVCTDCHGNMTALANPARTPWATEPKCQSCHTGDALNHLGRSIRLRVTYSDAPSIATFRVAKNKRFAENPDTLYRNSLGHNGVACESCHGSPHAEWPSREQNDNLAAENIQGHAGPIVECVVCHGARLPLTTKGPHGLHNINDPAWYSGGHSKFANQTCQACHGLGRERRLQGTVLSRAAAKRVFRVEDRTVTIPKGKQIGCVLCHTPGE